MRSADPQSGGNIEGALPTRRGSVGKRRAESLTEAQRPQPLQSAVKEQETHTTRSSAPRATAKPERSGVSRFLAFLNCCASPEGDDAARQPEGAVSSRKVTKTRPSQSAPSAVHMKQDVSKPLQSPAHLVKTQEKPSSLPPQTLNTSNTTSEKMPMSSSQGRDPQAGKLTPDTPAAGHQHVPERNGEKPLPASPKPVMPVVGAAVVGGAAMGVAAGAFMQNGRNTQPGPPEVLVSPATPILPQGEDTISDRTTTQKQIDEDIEMTDHGPSLPLASTELVSAEESPITQADHTAAQVNLPPSPPLAQRQAQMFSPTSRSSLEEANSSVAGSGSEPQRWLLPPLRPEMKGKKCLVLDLDETLVHSSFKVCSFPFQIHFDPSNNTVGQILHQADFTIPVEIEGQYHNVYVIKRPGVDQFMKRVGELYEVVVFTASVSKVVTRTLPL